MSALMFFGPKVQWIYNITLTIHCVALATISQKPDSIATLHNIISYLFMYLIILLYCLSIFIPIFDLFASATAVHNSIVLIYLPLFKYLIVLCAYATT